jgi:hypothetical protein
VPGKEKEFTQWWNEENAREQYKSFGWDVKDTLLLPSEEDTEAVKLRRERLAERARPPLSFFLIILIIILHYLLNNLI